MEDLALSDPWQSIPIPEELFLSMKEAINQNKLHLDPWTEVCLIGIYRRTTSEVQIPISWSKWKITKDKKFLYLIEFILKGFGNHNRSSKKQAEYGTILFQSSEYLTQFC